MDVNLDFMSLTKPTYDPKFVDLIEAAEKKIMSFVTDALFKVVGYSRALVLVRGTNTDSFTKIISSLSG